MTNNDLVKIWNAGAYFASTHDLSAEDALKVVKFKLALKEAFERFDAKQKAIDDPKRDQMLDLLLKEEVKLDINPISFEAYHALARENRAVNVQLATPDGESMQATFDPFTLCEMELMGVLWDNQLL